MPFSSRSNNRILPANSRAVDVAKRTLQTLIPIQQRKYANAFEVNGYEAIVYNRLRTGIACSCQARRSAGATLLDESGKLSPGHMDQLLTGGLEFKVNTYGARIPMRTDLREIRGFKPKIREDQFFDGLEDETEIPDFEIGDTSQSNPFVNRVQGDTSNFTNGPVNNQTLDDLSESFDGEAYTNDTKCTVCMGSGYVGAFSILNGLRLVLSTQWSSLGTVSGSIETNVSPHRFRASLVEFNVVLPRGFVGIDSFRIWDNDTQVVPDDVLLDGLPFSTNLLAALCDGRSHKISIVWNEIEDRSTFSHVELQLNLSTKRALFELPRMQEGSNMALEDATEDLSVNASPEIPSIRREDILVESTFGKVLIVSSSNFWNDNQRNVLGWDLQTRVIQPSELLHFLPRRTLIRQKATYLVRDNGSGIRRT